MGMMILMTLAQMTINLIIQTVQYGLMAYVIARCVRAGWKGK